MYIHKNKKEMQIRKGSYTSNDLFKLVVDGSSIKWYQNNNLLHSETKSLGEKYKVFALVHNTRNGNQRCNAFEDVSVTVPKSNTLEPFMVPKSGADSFRFREEAEFSFRKSEIREEENNASREDHPQSLQRHRFLLQVLLLIGMDKGCGNE